MRERCEFVREASVSNRFSGAVDVALFLVGSASRFFFRTTKNQRSARPGRIVLGHGALYSVTDVRIGMASIGSLFARARFALAAEFCFTIVTTAIWHLVNSDLASSLPRGSSEYWASILGPPFVVPRNRRFLRIVPRAFALS